MANITLRPAVLEDLDDMLAVFYSAFQDSALNRRSFPPSDPTSHEHNAEHFRSVLTDGFSDVLIAEDHSVAVAAGQKPYVAGWGRWVRRAAREELPPRPVYTRDMYPAGGDQEFAARFFQANTDASRSVIGLQAHWFLTIMLVRKESQRKGVGSLLMRYGTERADQDGWMAYVNASAEGRPLYERHGFVTVKLSEFDDEPEVKTWHMKRDAKKVDA